MGASHKHYIVQNIFLATAYTIPFQFQAILFQSTPLILSMAGPMEGNGMVWGLISVGKGFPLPQNCRKHLPRLWWASKRSRWLSLKFYSLGLPRKPVAHK